ncbi:TEP-4 [Biomphalaria glabrata]|nr:TEP-4 [Biomphalaria glabrata]
MMWTTTMVYPSWMTQPTMMNQQTTVAPDTSSGGDNLQAPVRTRVNFAETFLWGELKSGYFQFRSILCDLFNIPNFFQCGRSLSGQLRKRCFASFSPVMNLVSSVVSDPITLPVTETETKTEDLQQPTKTRSNFVETWLWNSLDIGLIFIFHLSCFKVSVLSLALKHTLTPKDLSIQRTNCPYIPIHFNPCRRGGDGLSKRFCFSSVISSPVNVPILDLLNQALVNTPEVALQEPTRTRSVFVESWLWDSVTTTLEHFTFILGLLGLMVSPIGKCEWEMMMDKLPVQVGGAINTLTDNQMNGNSLKEPSRTRINFVETFLWDSVWTGANGSASITATVPDTITSWVASAFAINSASGLGVAPTQAHLRVFRPFFVSLNLPYSVTRGEHLALQANVFNYMTEDMQVRVTLAKSDNFFNIEIDANGAEVLKQVESVQDVMIKAGEAKSVYFPIVPADLGKIDIEVKAQSTKAADAVRRQLLVEAEGVPKIYNVPVLIDLTEGKTSFSKTVDLTLPSNTVKGSELARISAVGDLMGPTIAGLDSLLQMPTGCGEQTMIGLAPDVYVTDYLKSVNQLSGDIQTKALSYMESGYQRELTYKHTDSSFSAFGNSDASGSMWLTAFVTRVFKQAKAHIYIDDEVLIKAIQWMVSKQNANGSFPEPGNVIHKNMQGQAGSGVGLTLFVLISLLENKDLLVNTNAAGVLVDEARQKALVYAEQEVAKTDDLYILNMAAYAFQLANSSQVQTVLNKLEQKATVKDGRKYWHQPEQPKTTNTWDYPNPTKAVDIEMTSYALLTYAARGNIVAGKSIMQWLTEQRNSNGGFSSTQDTVLALNALSEFAKQTYSNNFNVQITTQLNATTSYTFNIDKTNSLLLQSRETPNVPSQVKIDATGSGMALVQVAVSFNVESEIFETTFDLTVKLIEETINNLFVETCAKWLGSGPSSAMAVQEIGIPSGFEADLESIPQLDILKRIETQNKKVILYFDQIGTTPVCLNFRAVRTGLVAKSQPAAIRVYDYYEPRNQVTAFYQSQILKDSTVCDVCKECDNCV